MPHLRRKAQFPIQLLSERHTLESHQVVSGPTNVLLCSENKGEVGGGEFTEEAKETTEANGRGHRVRDTMSGTER